jgi:hypothetical protein
MKRFIAACLVTGIGVIGIGGCAADRVDRVSARRLAQEDPSSTPAPPQEDPRVRAVLERVASFRKLPIVHPVVGKSLGRKALLEKLKAKVEKDLPKGVLELQGESLRAIGLIPVDYDFEAGVLKLLQEQIAGYYDPDDRTMYLMDDLSDSMKEETLNHELVHALQDQSFGLGPLLKFREGEGDATSASQALVEGDATSAMIDIGTGEEGAGTRLNESFMRKMMSASSAFSADTPPFLQETLVSPYLDGLGFVNALRRKGGWAAVDAAFRDLPTTTEQILHPEKFFKREGPINVAAPVPEQHLGPGFRAVLVDSMGESGMRIAFGTRDPRSIAAKAAAGWGGDRFVLASKDHPDGKTYALLWSGTMDTREDAAELAGAFERLWATPKCRERPDLGPIQWGVREREFLVIAGPYTRGKNATRAAGDCRLLETKGNANPVN